MIVVVVDNDVFAFVVEVVIAVVVEVVVVVL